jgi:hypothetical protein
MPKPIYVIPGVRYSVTRPVVLDIVRQVLEWTALPKETETLFSGEVERVYQPGSTISEEEHFNKFNSETRWTIKFEETVQEDRILSSSVLYTDNPLIFADHQVKFFMRPAYAPTTIKITIGSKFVDENAARMWLDDIRTRVSMGRQTRTHFVSYSYLLPEECLLIAMKIHEMRETVAPYGEQFKDYWGEKITSKATILTDMIGKNKVWGIAETQARVVGYFDFDTAPDKGAKNAENSSWDAEFTYEFMMDTPRAIVMEYPLMVHNQLIPEMFRKANQHSPKPPEEFELSYSATAYDLAWFEQGRNIAGMSTPGVALPDFDEWYPADGAIYPDTLRIFTALCNIDENNPFALLDLTALSPLGLELDPDILAFMRTEAPFLTKYKFSFLNVAVYRNEIMMNPEEYSVTSDLMVQLASVQSLRDVYHVRFSIYQRPRLLPEPAKQRLRNNCTATTKMFLALDPSIPERTALFCLPGNYLTSVLYNQIAYDIDNRFDTQRNGPLVQFNTVMSLTVNAHAENRT